MSSIPTYIILATVSLSVTCLTFLLYSAYGFAAFKAAAPFVGTVILVFGEFLRLLDGRWRFLWSQGFTCSLMA